MNSHAKDLLIIFVDINGIWKLIPRPLRFEEDFLLEDAQELIVEELRKHCPAAENLIGRAFAIGMAA